MDYSDDTCKDLDAGNGFSPGQFERMLVFWDFYRKDDAIMNPAEEREKIDVYIEFRYDRYPLEISWGIYDSQGEAIVLYPAGSGRGTLAGTLAFPVGTYTLVIHDSAGDGSCCLYGLGYYMIAVGDQIIASDHGVFGTSETVTFSVGKPVSGLKMTSGAATDAPVSTTGPKTQSPSAPRIPLTVTPFGAPVPLSSSFPEVPSEAPISAGSLATGLNGPMVDTEGHTTKVLPTASASAEMIGYCATATLLALCAFVL